MKNTSVLIFGAAGFIGTYLIEALINEGFNITASDINQIGETYYKERNIPFINVDITNKGDFNKFEGTNFDVVIHLAATQPANVSFKNYDPSNYIQVNVIGTLNILDFCKNNQVKKIIYASSHRNTQGLWVNNKPVNELDGRSIKYTGEYAMFSISESAAQDCVLHYQAKFGLTGIIFRLPPVYGYGPHTEIFLNGKPIKTGFRIFIDNAIACKPLEIWGDSSIGRDIIYIKDVIAAFLKAIKNESASGLYNITSGYALSLKEEAETIAEVFWGNDSNPEIIEKPEIPNNIEGFVYDISKAKKDLDWAPAFNFKEMLLDYVREQNDNKFDYLIKKRSQQFKDDN